MDYQPFLPFPLVFEVQHYGDAALIFATHDGYPQIVNGLLYNQELGAIFAGEMLENHRKSIGNQ